MSNRTALLAAALLGLAALAPPARAQEPPPATSAERTAALGRLLADVAGPRKDDAEAWHQLGIEYNLAGETRKARDAFKRAVKLRPNFHAAHAGIAYTHFAEGDIEEAERVARKAAHAESRDVMSRRGVERPVYTAYNVLVAVRLRKFYNDCAAALAEAERALAAGTTNARWHLLKARALIGMSVGPQKIDPDLDFTPARTPPSEAERAAAREATEAGRKFIAEAVPHLEEYPRLGQLTPSEREGLAAQLAAARYHAGLSDSGEPHFNSFEVTARAVITAKPEPGFTERARRNDVEGLVRLRAVLAADGTVRHILVVKELPDGLTEKAVEAARRVRFRPAVKDGQPVNMVVQLEYHFNVY